MCLTLLRPGCDGWWGFLHRRVRGFSSSSRCARRNCRPRRCSSLTMSLDNVAADLTISTLEPLIELHLEGGTLSSAVLTCIARQKHLRRLVLKDIEVVDTYGNLEFLHGMKNLEELVIDNCPELLSEGFRSLASLPKLKHLNLAMSDLNMLDPLHVAVFGAELSLTLRGPNDLTELEWLSMNLNVVELRFEGFGQSEFPFWVARAANLRSLSFDNGTFTGEQRPLRVFPANMRSLSVVNCKLNSTLLNCLLRSGRNLTDVELCLTIFHDKIVLDHLENVQTLKIYGEKELDGEILGKVSHLHNLVELHVAGCMALKPHHLSQLRCLPNLKSLCLGSCSIRDEGCEVLFSFSSLSQLTLNSCCGPTFRRLNAATALSSLRVIGCLNVDEGILFSRCLSEHLNDFRFEPCV